MVFQQNWGAYYEQKVFYNLLSPSSDEESPNMTCSPSRTFSCRSSVAASFPSRSQPGPRRKDGKKAGGGEKDVSVAGPVHLSSLRGSL